MSKTSATALAGNLLRNLRILAVLTVVFLVVLAAAPFKWYNTEWRDIQGDYNSRARADGLRPMSVGLQQIWRPELGLADRCTSCHVGMGAAKPLTNGGPLYGRHPEVNHDVARMGCTVCHRGQGRATTTEAAHGRVAHWDNPMLPKPHLQASCGGCHGEAVRTPPWEDVERGEYLFELHGCQACHRVDGAGGRVGPDLSGVALKGFDREWHVRHLRDPGAVVAGSRMMSFGHLSDGEIDALLTYLDTLIGAPQLVRGKAVAVELGCRGCHKIGGLGGDRTDLEESARKPASAYDFTHVEGPHTLENWHRQHLRDPQRVSPGSTMPRFRLDPARERALITYILSLRRAEVPVEQLPRPTRLARLQEHRDFATDGASLFSTFCAACHGRDGRGQAMASLNVSVPDLRNPQTHAITSPAALRYTIEHGRPGRFMPAWNEAAGGLKPEEIDALVAYLRQDLPRAPAYTAVQASRVNLRHGQRVFVQDCAACHGPRGGGTTIAPSLASPEFLFTADDHYLYDTITHGRAGTAMPSHAHYDAGTLKSLIGWLRGQGRAELTTAKRRQLTRAVRGTLGVRDLDTYRASGSPAYGKVLYDALCAGCHGPQGRGNLGPTLGNPDFLRAVSDGFLAGTIVLGRSGRAMRAFGQHGLAPLAGREVGDLIVYLRTLATHVPAKPGYASVQGIPSRGKELFASYCRGCHGEAGAGGTAPALANPGFLDSVTDGFIQATLVRGRPGTAMRSWARGGYGFAELELSAINDITAYVRSLAKQNSGGTR